MYIINEYQFIKEYVEKNQMPEGISIKRWLHYLMKYYYQECANMTSRQYSEVILNYMKKCQLPLWKYDEWQYGDWVYVQCLKYRNGKLSLYLRNPKEIIITKPEMEIIKSCGSEQHQKVLFTLYVLAKMKEHPNGWVNVSSPDIFKLANVNLSFAERCYLLGDLDRAGVLTFSNRANVNGNKVELIEGEPEMIITQFKRIGNQYVGKYREGWIACEECGRLVKIKSNYDHSTKYCKTCATEVNRKKTREKMQQLRHLNNTTNQIINV